MRLVHAFFAEAAQPVGANLLDITSAGADFVVADSFPTILERLVLVCRLEASSGERDWEHEIVVEFVDAPGRRLRPANVYPWSPVRPQDEPDRLASITWAIDFSEMAIPAPGQYAAPILVNHIEMGVAALRVRQAGHRGNGELERSG